MRRAPVTTASDRGRSMPDTHADRLEGIGRALHSLSDEQRRLERMGLEPALGRCREERRYWTFLEALHRVASDTAAPFGGERP